MPVKGTSEMELLSPREFAPLESIMHASAENLPSVAKSVSDSALRLIAEQPSNARALCQCLFLSSIPELSGSHSATLPAANQAVWKDLQRELFEKVRPNLSLFSDQFHWASLLRVNLSEISIRETVDRFGVHSLYGTDRKMAQPFVRPFLLSMHTSRSRYNGSGYGHEDVDALRQAVAEIGQYLLEAPRPWFSPDPTLKQLAFPILHTSYSAHGDLDERELEGVLLVLLPLGELLLDEQTYGYGRTNGQIPTLISKWSKARQDNSYLPGALRSLRSVNLSPRVATFFEQWMRGEFSLVVSEKD